MLRYLINCFHGALAETYYEHYKRQRLAGRYELADRCYNAYQRHAKLLR